jgi:hypothetical protein
MLLLLKLVILALSVMKTRSLRSRMIFVDATTCRPVYFHHALRSDDGTKESFDVPLVAVLASHKELGGTHVGDEVQQQLPTTKYPPLQKCDTEIAKGDFGGLVNLYGVRYGIGKVINFKIATPREGAVVSLS